MGGTALSLAFDDLSSCAIALITSIYRTPKLCLQNGRRDASTNLGTQINPTKKKPRGYVMPCR